jgi:hypothetical protein
LRRSVQSRCASPDGPLALWHIGLELLRAAHWFASLHSASVLSTLALSMWVKSARAEKGSGFYTNQSALPFRKRARKGAEKMNTYEIVTERIINLLECGVIPWRRSWAATGLPRNLVSKKPYRGVNVRREVA